MMNIICVNALLIHYFGEIHIEMSYLRRRRIPYAAKLIREINKITGQALWPRGNQPNNMVVMW